MFLDGPGGGQFIGRVIGGEGVLQACSSGRAEGVVAAEQQPAVGPARIRGAAAAWPSPRTVDTL